MTGAPDMLRAALAVAERGLAVFPVWPALPFKDGAFICGCGRLSCTSPAKHPIPRLCPHGVTDATADPARVRWLWGARRDANIALATGVIVAIDIDPRHGGTADALGDLPPTWRAATGGGGEHIFFRAAPAGAPIRNSAGKLALGIDVRGVGGYVVLAPSLHISGRRYAWQPGGDPDHAELAPLPASIARALAEPTTSTKTASANWCDLVSANVGEGARNSTIAKLAGHLLRHYVEPRVVLELLLAWNNTRCVPPLANDEVARTVNSIAGKEMKRRNAS